MNNKLTILLSVFVLTVGQQVRAQDEVPIFGLDECQQYAIDNSFLMKNSTLDEELAESKVRETIGIGLPQVTGSATVQHSPKLNRFFAEYSENGSFALTPDQATQLGVEPGDVYAAENFFQLKSNADLGVGVQQMIFNGSYIVGVKASKAYKELSVKRTNKALGDLKADVAKAYFNYLINKDRLRLYDANVDRVEMLYNQTKAMYDNGVAEKIDVDRLKVTLNNSKADRDNVESLFDLSEKLLKFQINYPLEDSLVIAGTFDDVLERAVSDFDYEADYDLRPDYQVLLASRELQKLDLKNKYVEALPTVYFFANAGWNTQSPTIGGLFATESDFEEVGSFGRDKWYGYSLLGIKLNWNIFTGLQRHEQIQQRRLDLEKIDNQIEWFEAQIEVEVKDTKSSFGNARSRLEVQKENMELAESILKNAEIKYKEGVGSNLELVDADNSLTAAQTNYYNALFETVISKIDLYRALGRDK